MSEEFSIIAEKIEKYGDTFESKECTDAGGENNSERGHVDSTRVPSDNGHVDLSRVSSNLSIGSFDGNKPTPINSKKMSVTSTLSSSSDQPYISLISGYNKHRKVSEGLPPFISLLSQNDAAESESACNNVFEIIHEESEKVQNNKFGSRAPQGSTRRITRERREIFPGYEKTVLDRSKMTNNEESWNENDEHVEADIDNEYQEINLRQKNDKSLMERRRRSFNPPLTSGLLQETSNPDTDLKTHFSRHGLRATIGNGEIKKRSRAAPVSNDQQTSNVKRSQSMKKPFHKRGFLKTLKNLKL